MFLWVSNPGTVCLAYLDYMVLDPLRTPHSPQASPGMELLRSLLSLSHWRRCCQDSVLCGLCSDTSLPSKAIEGTSWGDGSIPDLYWDGGYLGLSKVMNLYTEIYELHFMYMMHDDFFPLKIKLSRMKGKKENADLWGHHSGFISCFCPCDLGEGIRLFLSQCPYLWNWNQNKIYLLQKVLQNNLCEVADRSLYLS